MSEDKIDELLYEVKCAREDLKALQQTTHEYLRDLKNVKEGLREKDKVTFRAYELKEIINRLMEES